MLFLNNLRTKKNVHLILILAPRGASIFLGGGYKLLYNNSFIYIDNKQHILRDRRISTTRTSPFWEKSSAPVDASTCVSTAWSSFQRSLTHRRFRWEWHNKRWFGTLVFWQQRWIYVLYIIYIQIGYVLKNIIHIIWIKQMSCLTRCYKHL